MRNAKMTVVLMLIVLVVIFVVSANAGTAVERFQVDGVKSALVANRLETKLENVEGVKDASVSAAGDVKVRFDSTRTSDRAIREAAEQSGYTVSETLRATPRHISCC